MNWYTKRIAIAAATGCAVWVGAVVLYPDSGPVLLGTMATVVIGLLLYGHVYLRDQQDEREGR